MQSNKLVCLDLGCGMRKPKDNGTQKWFGVDIRPFEGVDFVANIGKEPIPMKDNSVDLVTSVHLFEHLYPEELFHCIDECWRVLKPSGSLKLSVPMAGTPAFYVHPDHKIQFTVDTFGFFQVPGNEDHSDPHGYLKGFWHVSAREAPGNPQAIDVDMHPNKRGGRFEYVEVKKLTVPIKPVNI